jgi:DNA-binding CsgD family transcriptional regulator/tetratricopeptide (TPR) repeat protein
VITLMPTLIFSRRAGRHAGVNGGMGRSALQEMGRSALPGTRTICQTLPMAAIAPAPVLDRPAERLVGRTSEVETLERSLDELARGGPGALAFIGEPGIGKTRLMRELEARAEQRGDLVLYGAASELERDVPFAVFVDALDEYLESLDPTDLMHLDEDARAELAHVFPSLSGLAGDAAVAPQQERYPTHRAVRALLEHLARTKPLVLALDDIHWADAASIELLGVLLRKPPGAAVLMALAVRPRQVPERLLAALERAHRAGSLTRIDIPALTPAEARDLLGESFDEAALASLYRESGGNPLYMEQLAGTADGAVGGRPQAGSLLTGLGIPGAVAASLGDELGALSDGTRRVLEGAAVAGDPFEPDLAAEAAQTSEAQALMAVDELLELDLIRETDVPRRFRFRHPIVRRAVYESTRGGWRLGAHERCAMALAARGATAAARAHHVERSARQGDRTAVAVLREAGEAAARLAPESAANWFGGALRLLPEEAPSAERIPLLVARASSLAATGRFVESRRDLLESVDLAARDAPEWRGRATTACAAVEHLLGLQKEAHRHLASALADLGGATSADAVALMVELSVDGLHAGDFRAMQTWAARAVTAAKPLGQPALVAAAVAIRAWASAAGGSGPQAQEHSDEATELIDELSDDVLAGRLDALANLASADLFLDRFPAATRHAERALRIGRATGQAVLLPVVVAMLGGSLWVQGKPREAGRLFEEAVESARLAGNVESLAWMLFNRSIAALAAGDLDVALSTAEESVELEDRLQPGVLSGTAAAVLGAALLEAGQAERCVDVIVSRAGGEEIQLVGGSWRVRFLEVLVRALLAIRRRPDAARVAATARACADIVALPSAEGFARLAEAAMHLDEGTPITAADDARAAAEAFDSVAASWDAARSRSFAGLALAAAGESGAAADQLGLAAAGFHSFGSIRYRDQAEHELRKLGRRIHRRSRPGSARGSGLGELTERELEVARLVADRRTNPEISAALFLSQKTVETHLRNIFNKVGVDNRVALARLVEGAARGASDADG